VRLEGLLGKVQLKLLEASRGLQATIGRARLPIPPTPYELQILADLRTEGVHVTSIGQLMPDFPTASREVLLSASEFLKNESNGPEAITWRRGENSYDLTGGALLARLPEAYLLGLNEQALALALRYFGLPVGYHGAVLRHSLIDGQVVGPRLWHKDAEDFHVLRMVVYLNDVSLGGGPFEYIPRSLRISYRQFRGLETRLTNDVMSKVVPVGLWRQIAGPAGTIVLCDTAKTFHHESLQTESERFVIMIGYSSRRPNGMELAMQHFPVERVKPALLQIIPQANFGHVFDWRRQSS
jgi:hypothetical protein